MAGPGINTGPIEFLLEQKISVIHSIHRSGSRSIVAVEIETKHGRVVNFGRTDLSVAAGAVTPEILSSGEPGVLVRIDLTARLSFAFKADQLVARVEDLQSTNQNPTGAHAWQVCFSSGDYFVLFRRDGVIDIVCNELPHDYYNSTV